MKTRFLFALAASGALLAGCASTPTPTNPLDGVAKQFQPRPGQASLYIGSGPDASGNGPTFQVLLDGRRAGDLPSIQRLLENFGDERTVSVIRLVDQDGKVLAGNHQLGDETVVPELKLEPVFSREKLMVDLWTGENYFAVIQIGRAHV